MSWYIKSNINDIVQTLIQEIKTLVSNVDVALASKVALNKCKHCDEKIPKVRIGKINGYEIFIVNGDSVKTQLEMDFVEGGNERAYSSESDPDHRNVIPKDEIWLSAELRPEFIPYVLFHETLEAFIMDKTNLSYSKAHELANAYEKKLREQKFF